MKCAARTLIEEALAKSPQAYGLLGTVWNVRELGALLAHWYGVKVSMATVHWAVLELGYRYCRPQHDLTHA
jgi:hypothetical protein